MLSTARDVIYEARENCRGVAEGASVSLPRAAAAAAGSDRMDNSLPFLFVHSLSLSHASSFFKAARFEGEEGKAIVLGLPNSGVG